LTSQKFKNRDSQWKHVFWLGIVDGWISLTGKTLAHQWRFFWLLGGATCGAKRTWSSDVKPPGQAENIRKQNICVKLINWDSYSPSLLEVGHQFWIDIIIYVTVRCFLQPTASFQDELRLFHAKKPENMGGNWRLHQDVSSGWPAEGKCHFHNRQVKQMIIRRWIRSCWTSHEISNTSIQYAFNMHSICIQYAFNMHSIHSTMIKQWLAGIKNGITKKKICGLTNCSSWRHQSHQHLSAHRQCTSTWEIMKDHEYEHVWTNGEIMEISWNNTQTRYFWHTNTMCSFNLTFWYLDIFGTSHVWGVNDFEPISIITA
jgi:hypothetical protein